MANPSLPEDRRAPAFSFYPKDFLVGTVTLSLAERGAYITLLSWQWDSGGVPDDATERARILGCSRKDEAATWTRVSEKFQRGTDGLWRNQRLERERDKQIDRRAALAANGHKGAERRWSHKPNDGPANGQANGQAIAPPMANAWQTDGLSSSSSSSSSSSEKSKIKSTGAARRPVENWEPDEGSFGLYCKIALESKRMSSEQDGSESISNIAAIFKELCAGRRLSYDSELASRAIAAVVRAEERQVS